MTKKTKYTTIQVKKEINDAIRQFCKENGLIASFITEKYWMGFISSSISGSLFT